MGITATPRDTLVLGMATLGSRSLSPRTQNHLWLGTQTMFQSHSLYLIGSVVGMGLFSFTPHRIPYLWFSSCSRCANSMVAWIATMVFCHFTAILSICFVGSTRFSSHLYRNRAMIGSEKGTIGRLSRTVSMLP